jgi:hypothetical protein
VINIDNELLISSIIELDKEPEGEGCMFYWPFIAVV